MRKNHGFTLIELLIVITIIGILTVLGARQFGNAVDRANATADLANAQTIANSVRQALLMGDVKSTGTLTLAAPTGTNAITGTDNTIDGITKYLGSTPEIKAGASVKTWNIAFNIDTQVVTVSVDGHVLSPRPSALPTVWANAQ